MLLAEYLDWPELQAAEPGFELDEGTLVKMSPTARRHGKRIDRLYRYLIQHLPEDRYDILAGEVGFILGGDPNPTVRAADLAVLYREDNVPEGFSKEPPLLAIEVVSPSNDPEDIEKKRIQYLEAGSKEVWIVYEKTNTLHVFQQENRAFIFNREAEFESILGFHVVVDEILR